MKVRVFGVRSDGGTLAYGRGVDVKTGEPVAFVGGHRELFDISRVVSAAATEDELPVVVVPSWTIGWER